MVTVTIILTLLLIICILGSIAWFKASQTAYPRVHDHEIIYTGIFLLSLIRKYVHKLLVNHLVNFEQEKVLYIYISQEKISEKLTSTGIL